MRPNRLRRLRRIATTTVVALSLLAPGASAYWSNAGEGSASASLATLSAPTIDATPGNESVELTGGRSPPPAGARSNTLSLATATARRLPGSRSPSTVTSCTDTVSGRHPHIHGHRGLALLDGYERGKNGHRLFGPATHLVLEAASATPTAGEADSLTVLAKDASNATVSSYSGTHSLTFEGANDATNGEEPTVRDKAGVGRVRRTHRNHFIEGKATVSGATNGVMGLYKAGEAHIKVKEGSLNNGAGLAVTVKAASTKKLAISTR